jgi:hypothetical protein
MIWQEKILRTGITSFLRDNPIECVLFKKRLTGEPHLFIKAIQLENSVLSGFIKNIKRRRSDGRRCYIFMIVF